MSERTIEEMFEDGECQLIDSEIAKLIEQSNNIKRLPPRFGTVERISEDKVFFRLAGEAGNQDDAIIPKTNINIKDLRRNDKVTFNILQFNNKIRYWFEVMPRVVVTAEDIYEEMEKISEDLDFEVGDD